MSHAASGPSERFVVPPKLSGERFDRVLEQLVPGHSRAQLQKLVRKGAVTLDGRRVLRSNLRVRGGERVEVVFGSPAKGPAEKGLAITVLYEDDHVVALSKPAGLLTHAVRRGDEDSVARQLVARFGPLPTVGDEPRPGIVHRLDRWTSGVLVAARTEEALTELRNQFRLRRAKKRYLAVVEGCPQDEHFTVDDPLGPEPGPRNRERIDPTGRPSRTRVARLETRGERTLLACWPETGRRHQIRVHLASRGLPVVGDVLYAAGSRKELAGDRHLLHASELVLRHPTQERELSFHAAAPADFHPFSDTAQDAASGR